MNDDEQSEKVSLHGKKRGRRMTELDKYLRDSDLKIKEWKKKLKNDKHLSSKDKQKYRNMISAQMSRVKKKQEVDNLQFAGNSLRQNMLDLIKILDEELTGEVRERVQERVET